MYVTRDCSLPTEFEEKTSQYLVEPKIKRLRCYQKCDSLSRFRKGKRKRRRKEPDDTLYDTLYRFLVLFGVPKEKSQWKEGSRVWRAIDSCLGSEYASYASNATTRSRRNVTNPSVPIKEGLDFAQYKIDCSKFSILNGENEHIARARKSLERINGGMDLLFSLVSFDPNRRSSPLDVMNSTFMEPLREGERKCESSDTDIVYSYMSYSL